MVVQSTRNISSCTWKCGLHHRVADSKLEAPLGAKASEPPNLQKALVPTISVTLEVTPDSDPDSGLVDMSQWVYQVTNFNCTQLGEGPWNRESCDLVISSLRTALDNRVEEFLSENPNILTERHAINPPPSVPPGILGSPTSATELARVAEERTQHLRRRTLEATGLTSEQRLRLDEARRFRRTPLQTDQTELAQILTDGLQVPRHLVGLEPKKEEASREPPPTRFERDEVI